MRKTRLPYLLFAALMVTALLAAACSPAATATTAPATSVPATAAPTSAPATEVDARHRRAPDYHDHRALGYQRHPHCQRQYHR